MIYYLLDTDHLTLYDLHHPILRPRIDGQPPNSVAISAVTVDEVMRGRLAEIARHRGGAPLTDAYKHLVDSVRLMNGFPIVEFDASAEAEYQRLLFARLRVGTMDLRIAAVAIVNRLTVLTRNTRDFKRVLGLTVEDWTI
jgi:tRNA(fMet)-specific endonuclease VapC